MKIQQQNLLHLHPPTTCSSSGLHVCFLFILRQNKKAKALLQASVMFLMFQAGNLNIFNLEIMSFLLPISDVTGMQQ